MAFADPHPSGLRDKLLSVGRGGGRRGTSRENCDGCLRFLNFARFCLGCSASLFQVLAPWVLSTIELVTVSLIYFLGTSKSLIVHEPANRYHFNWMCSLEDIIVLALARSLLLSLTYAWGMHNVHSAGSSAHRTYLYTSYLLAAACFPYILVKTLLYHYESDAVPAAAIFFITGAFCWIHVFSARRTVEWARRRFQMGLAGFSYPWEEGEEAMWTSLRRPDIEEMSSKNSERGGPGGVLLDSTVDVPPETLADADSRFMDVCGIKVHYKEVWPSGLCHGARSGSASESCSSGSSDAGLVDMHGTGIVLVHGFGGGVFAWRHIMEALALQCQCRVVAFDRPAFVGFPLLVWIACATCTFPSPGLTSRPVITHEVRTSSSNPYSMVAQAELMMQLCSQLGLRRVLLLAHGDACLLALRAAYLSDQASESGAAAAEAAEAAEGAEGGSGGGGGGGGGAAEHDDAAAVSADGVLRQLTAAAAAVEQLPHICITIPPEGTSAAPAGAAGAGLSRRDSIDSGPRSPSVGGRGANMLRRRPPSTANFFADSLQGVNPAPGLSVADAARCQQPGPEAGQAPAAQDNCLPAAAVDGCSADGMSPVSSGDVSRAASSEIASPCIPFCGTDQPQGYALGELPSISCDSECVPAPLMQQPPAWPSAPLVEETLRSRHACGSGAEAGPASTSSGLWGMIYGGSGGAVAGGQWSKHRRGGPSLGSTQPLGCSTPDAHMVAESLCSKAPAPWPTLIGLALLHPNLLGQMGPTLSSLLASSTFGRSILRPLLRSEVGEVANRRAWHHAERLTQEVLELYKTPLRVEGWDMALMETARLGKEHMQGDMAAHLEAARKLPMLAVTASHDHIATTAKVEKLCSSMPLAEMSVLPDCGHLSHEEVPGLLLQELMPFCGQVLLPHQH